MAAYRTLSTRRLMLKCPHPAGPPISAVTASEISGACFSTSLAQAIKIRKRSDGGRAAHTGNACRAASTARTTSCVVAAAARVAGSPV